MNKDNNLLANVTVNPAVANRRAAATAVEAQHQGGTNAMSGMSPELQAILGRSAPDATPAATSPVQFATPLTGIHELGAAAPCQKQ
mmetsp:Transcript_40728/g.85283  ORF Transcript_40728/g.85283 Transcript_40728/m.85283 type:complete len:86 (-) Transcript_40728:504-761(-)